MISLKSKIRSVSLAALIFTSLISKAQVKGDSTVGLSSDSVRLKSGKVVHIRSYAARFDPRKALFYSAILPGAGQVYNKKYWKVPLVYGGLVGLIVVVKYYNDYEGKYKGELFYLLNNPGPNPTTQTYPGTFNTQTTLRRAIDQTRRQRDYFAILTGFFYILQLVDAHVDAHLKEFDLNPQLHVRLAPAMVPGNGVGMGLTLKF